MKVKFKRRRKINLAKQANKRCERCYYFSRYSKSKTKGANPLGYCSKHDKEFRYWDYCGKFIWKDKYLGIIFSQPEPTASGKFLCKRCGRPLTDRDSIARGFGKECYEKHVRELIRQSKRLF